jgi:hypothetical protein
VVGVWKVDRSDTFDRSVPTLLLLLAALGAGCEGALGLLSGPPNELLSAVGGGPAMDEGGDKDAATWSADSDEPTPELALDSSVVC